MFDKNMTIYKQEGSFGFYQILFPFPITDGAMKKYLPKTYGAAWGFFKNNFGQVYFQEKRMDAIAKVFLKLADGTFPKGWEKHWADVDRKLTETTFKISQEKLEGYSIKQLGKLYREAEKLDRDMWAIAIFIDSFDAGTDQREIAKRVKMYKFTAEETETLLLPAKPSYASLLDDALYRYKGGKLSFAKFVKQFFWLRADYLHFGEVTQDFLEVKIQHAHLAHFISPLARQKKILKKYKLKENPFSTFQILSLWRDDRKRLNFTGIYGLVRILQEVFRRQKVSPKLINGLLPQEALALFSESVIDAKQLERRIVEGVFIHLKSGALVGYEAGRAGEALAQELEKMLLKVPTSELKGMVACKGYARGTVRIILSAYGDEAKKMKAGDILVSSMTRPEFASLMKMSGAIITDEGGISCHAAIVARELGKPCIIGTKIATQVLKDGDMVEVDANSGIVRKL